MQYSRASTPFQTPSESNGHHRQSRPASCFSILHVSDRQQQVKCRVAGTTIESNGPVMLGNKSLRKCQPESAAAYPPRYQRIKNPITNILRNTRAIVADLHA